MTQINANLFCYATEDTESLNVLSSTGLDELFKTISRRDSGC